MVGLTRIFEKSTGTGIGGFAFVDWLLGSFWEFEDTFQVCQVEPWMCIGWNRKQRAPENLNAANSIVARLDSDTLNNIGERAIGKWLSPFPLVFMREGQNRVDLHIAHSNLAMHLQTMFFLSAACFY